MTSASRGRPNPSLQQTAEKKKGTQLVFGQLLFGCRQNELRPFLVCLFALRTETIQVPQFYPTYRTAYRSDGSNYRVDGVSTLVIVHDGDYWLQPMHIYEDGLIDCRGFISFDGFKVKVREGWIVWRVPEGSRVNVSDFTSFTLTDAKSVEDSEEFLKELAYQLDRLRGEDTSVQRCFQALDDWKREPSEENHRALMTAAHAVPYRRRRRMGSGLGRLPPPEIEES